MSFNDLKQKAMNMDSLVSAAEKAGGKKEIIRR